MTPYPPRQAWRASRSPVRRQTALIRQRTDGTSGRIAMPRQVSCVRSTFCDGNTWLKRPEPEKLVEAQEPLTTRGEVRANVKWDRATRQRGGTPALAFNLPVLAGSAVAA